MNNTPSSVFISIWGKGNCAKSRMHMTRKRPEGRQDQLPRAEAGGTMPWRVLKPSCALQTPESSCLLQGTAWLPSAKWKTPRRCHSRAPSSKESSLARYLGGRVRVAQEQGLATLAMQNHTWVLSIPEQKGGSIRAEISHLQAIWNISSRTRTTTGDVDSPG